MTPVDGMGLVVSVSVALSALRVIAWRPPRREPPVAPPAAQPAPVVSGPCPACDNTMTATVSGHDPETAIARASCDCGLRLVGVVDEGEPFWLPTRPPYKQGDPPWAY